MRIAIALACASVLVTSCKAKSEPTPREGSSVMTTKGSAGSGSGSGSGSAATAGFKAFAYDRISRADFNRLAVRQNLPIYWIADKNSNQAIDPDETATLLFYSTSPTWVEKGAFTADFQNAYDQLVDAAHAPPFADPRRALVAKDLDQGRATLVFSDLSGLDGPDRAFVAAMLEVAKLTDDLYAIQKGSAALVEKLGPDPESQSLFRRNTGPRCVAPLTEADPNCTATTDGSKPKVSVYPDAIAGKPQGDAAFCETLEKQPNAKDLVSPFTVVTDTGGKLAAIPYTKAYAAQMTAIAGKLADAAKTQAKKPEEAALVAYLTAAAKSFTTNDWVPADEAWAKMSVANSKWYVRAAPDETYWEPCAHKASFHLTFAQINQDSKFWQSKLTPLLQDMEAAIAKKAGPPYAARQVKVHLPDFIDIVTNSGDDRNPLGATIGESLPNFGPVANQGRGRTVAMVNLYGDRDSIDARTEQAKSVFGADTLAAYDPSPAPGLLATILHEATHNLGPAHEYQVGGKAATLVFGGQIASMLEELKAESGAVFLVELLRQKGLVSDALAKQVYAYAMVWACGHISEGMYAIAGGQKTRKAYSQLAAIQLGYFIEHGAITFDAAAPAANGKDAGSLVIHFDKMPATADALMGIVAGIKARGDVKGAEELIRKYVDADAIVPHKLITERFLRFPKASFVYAVKTSK